WRLILYHARLSLMLGDHFYSSQDADYTWRSDLSLYANTDRKSGELKQKLDEHIVGVAKHALQMAHLLPAFEVELPEARDIKSLKKLSPTDYRWQDKAVDEIKNWKQRLPESQRDNRQSFFLVNMASTGCGKTFANAKIMRALSSDSESLRYILALGLRTLTLQTGDEYRDRIGLDNSELAVLIGSKAVTELHVQNKENKIEESTGSDENAGSESLELLLDEDVDYQCAIPENRLSTVLPDERSRKFLYAPVLACTIDHLMAATETKRGGRYILPGLRLMSSDLVIDEIDDFDGKDLIAIGRLIHLAGMLGRKVMISSATIPPSLAEGYFNAYREGWQVFARTREVSANMHCAWIDEFNTHVASISKNRAMPAVEDYKNMHTSFVEKRIQKLKKENIRRKGEIIKCVAIKTQNHVTEEDKQNIEDAYFKTIQQAVIQKHLKHSRLDEHSKKQVSFGVVRIANINPCVALTEYLSNAAWPENIDIRVMAYHSQQVMLMRSEQEKHLDSVLKRKQADAPFTNPVIKNHLKTIKAEQVIFILVVTPVEEVGRDHDFDWAVIEPSSYRSIIQLAGRVLRHRDYTPQQPNIGIMQYNLKALKNSEGKAAYTRPGYERVEKAYRFTTHDMSQLVDENVINCGINAIPRIQRNKKLKQNDNFADLEHFSIEKLLTTYNDKGPEAMQGWLTQCWWLTALPQTFNPFREGSMQLKLFLVPVNGRFSFMEKDKSGRP
ncbi:MAG: type I-F CRISPR-associated helicase Cas3f, partial [Candidatus Anammoxibacter sp.]